MIAQVFGCGPAWSGEPLPTPQPLSPDTTSVPMSCMTRVRTAQDALETKGRRSVNSVAKFAQRTGAYQCTRIGFLASRFSERRALPGEDGHVCHSKVRTRLRSEACLEVFGDISRPHRPSCEGGHALGFLRNQDRGRLSRANVASHRPTSHRGRHVRLSRHKTHAYGLLGRLCTDFTLMARKR